MGTLAEGDGGDVRVSRAFAGLGPWVVAWAVLSVVGSWVQLGLWGGSTHLDGLLSTQAGRAIANLVALPTQAFNTALMILLHMRADRSAVLIVSSVVIGWACVLFGLRTLLRVWVRVRSVLVGAGPSVVRERHAVVERGGPAIPSRRAFLLDGPLVIGGAAGGLVGAHSVVVAPFDLRIERYTVGVRDLARGLEGMRLVQISDTHLGPHVPPEFVARVVRESIALRPDVFVLTGDYVHRGTDCNARAAALFAPLVETGRPVIGVLGNHDWYGDGRDMKRQLSGVGVRMVDNDRVFIDAATRGMWDRAPAAGVCIAGLGDFGRDTMDIEAAFRDVPEEMPRIVLQHQPDAVETRAFVEGPRMDVIFAGHTHGGQIRLPLIGAPVTLSRYGQKYASGLAQGPRCPVVVSRGIGMSFLPVRIGVRPEVVEVTLTRM
ncbi:MAG: metallophosphoesterase [Phycisphaeraceae bacterium]|nr:metallophosphoesterase [Phycisphaeraceae bacterium]